MKRQIIKIDEEKCNGCGRCAESCVEGAIQMVDGKARLISEVFCDGLGACLGECPVGAITVEQKESQPYDERQTIRRLVPQGEHIVALHLEHLRSHGQKKYYEEGIETLGEMGIPVPGIETLKSAREAASVSSQKVTSQKVNTGEKQMSKEEKSSPSCDCPHATQEAMEKVRATSKSTAREGMANWPIQLHLLNPDSTVFDDADLVIAADCTAFALPDFYKRFTKNKVLIIFCPKLDQATDIYVEKLAEIFTQHQVRSITVLRMLVPCCGGTSVIVREAIKHAGQNLDVVEYIVNFDGTMS
ncbi:MAG: 4Fe-4S binding protein [Planctomycetaceae bacterium]|nr:4Fe-4S binding protein [Planctomycetaceae bacterium]